MRALAPGLSLLLLATTGSSCCAIAGVLCPPKPPVESDLVTPERAYETFKEALRVGNAEVEYRTLSRALKDKQSLSFFKYQAGRGPFISDHRREFDLFLASHLVRVDYSKDRRTAVLVLSSEDLTSAFVLVNEPEYRIVTEGVDAEPIEGDLPPVDRLVERSSEGRRLTVSIEPAAEGWPSDRPIAEFVLRNQWRFLEILDIAERSFPSEGAAPPPKPTT